VYHPYRFIIFHYQNCDYGHIIIGVVSCKLVTNFYVKYFITAVLSEILVSCDMKGRWYLTSISICFIQFVYIQIQFLPHSKHCVSIAETKRLILFKELIAVCCENSTIKPINTLSGLHAEILNVNAYGTRSYHFIELTFN
jgi:hypothetical protein